MEEYRKIEEIIGELKQLGYYSYQIDDILLEMIGTRRWRDLDSGKLQSLVMQLEEYLEFARKCKR